MTIEQSAENPFVGIRHIGEEEAFLFSGREAETAQLLRFVEAYPVTVLTGPSGVGKSSLARCGVAHTLRMRWLSRSAHSLGLPLVVSTWGETQADEDQSRLLTQDIAGMFLETLLRDNKSAWRELTAFQEGPSVHGEWFGDHPDDLKALKRIIARKSGSSTLGAEALVDFLDLVSAACQGVVLIFDQFEEVLRFEEFRRTGRNATSEITDLIARLCTVKDVKCLLSLRDEYYNHLRTIEADHGPLRKSTMDLEDMPFDDAAKVFKALGASQGIQLEDTLLARIHKTQKREGRGSPSEGVDLSRWQGVLSEMWVALVKEAPTAETVFDLEALRRALGDEALDEDEDPFDVALAKIVQRALSKGATDPVDALRYQYFVVRAAPWLSVGGSDARLSHQYMYKRTISQSHLFQSIFGPTLENIERTAAATWASGWLLGELTSQGEGRSSPPVSKGVVIEQLKIKFREALLKLRAEKVLKMYRAPGASAAHPNSGGDEADAYWELTHDRLGTPLIAWASMHRDTVMDAAVSPLPSRGISPIRVDSSVVGVSRRGKRDRIWRHVIWSGCQVEPPQLAEGETTPVFESVHFDLCDFTGTVFSRCVFKDCTFLNCILNGAIFIDCSFRGGTFKAIGPAAGNSIGWIGTSFNDGVTFDKCHLTQPTFAQIAVECTVQFKNCRMFLASFTGRKAAKTKDSRLAFDKDCSGGFLMWDDSFNADLDELRVRKNEADKLIWPNSGML